MRENLELTCICCPLGCQIQVCTENGEVKEITGNTCRRGYEYAKTEVTAPTRTITSTVRVIGGKNPVVAVKTASAIPKDKIEDCMKAIYGITVKAPVAIGDVVCNNISGTGVALVASACD